MAALLLAGLLGGCSAIGPDYQRPALTDMPVNWKGAGTWQRAAPADAVPKLDWWRFYGDATLDRLEADCLAKNASLQVALAHLQAAQAQAGIQEAATLPSVGVGALATRTRTSANRPLSAYASQQYETVQNDIKPALVVNYEFDWLGQVRREVESARASAEQSRADAENVRLLLTAQLATAYFQLRELDEESSLVRSALALQQKVLQLTRLRHQGGIASASDEATQQAGLQADTAQLRLLANQRLQQEDLIATLSGTPAADFHLDAGNLPARLPAIPAGLPSDLLQRRPDIASAERAMAAANAQIGVAQAAWYPQLALEPTYAGYESNTLSSLVSAPAMIWSFGLQAGQMLFDNGKTRSAVESAKADYAATVATYRQTVLQGIQETQDALGTLQGLTQAEAEQAGAVASQGKVYAVSRIRYQDGLDNALTLAINQQNLLSAERLQTQLRGNQFVWSVSLFKALGGGWQPG
jgi:NodT family efflux transporter outer membrane factor (OMF) lipoprotein